MLLGESSSFHLRLHVLMWYFHYVRRFNSLTEVIIHVSSIICHSLNLNG